ncbi:MAG TPA: hypothetical protein PKE32_02175, partial [Miltoncostaeaceae bacterium]|nr:hypothetical protein [Miltoncostaeaceae bacterium]
MPLVLRHDGAGARPPLGPAGGLVVVGDRDAAARLRRSLIDAPDDGRTREVITLAALRARVATAVNHVPPPCPAPVLRRIALRAALDDPLLDAFGPAARTPGFLAALERALVELRTARITPERLAQVADRLPERALAAAYAATVALIEPVDLHWALVDAAEALTRFPPVSVVGVDEIIPPDWALLRRLARHTQVRVTLLHAPARRAFAAREGHWNARRADADRCEPVTVARSERDPRLAALIATVFEDREPPAIAGGAPVELIGCAGTHGLYRAALSRAL